MPLSALSWTTSLPEGWFIAVTMPSTPFLDVSSSLELGVLRGSLTSKAKWPSLDIAALRAIPGCLSSHHAPLPRIDFSNLELTGRLVYTNLENYTSFGCNSVSIGHQSGSTWMWLRTAAAVCSKPFLPTESCRRSRQSRAGRPRSSIILNFSLLFLRGLPSRGGPASTMLLQAEGRKTYPSPVLGPPWKGLRIARAFSQLIVDLSFFSFDFTFAMIDGAPDGLVVFLF